MTLHLCEGCTRDSPRYDLLQELKLELSRSKAVYSLRNFAVYVSFTVYNY